MASINRRRAFTIVRDNNDARDKRKFRRGRFGLRGFSARIGWNRLKLEMGQFHIYVNPVELRKSP